MKNAFYAVLIGAVIGLGAVISPLISELRQLVRDTDVTMIEARRDLHNSAQNTNAMLIQLGLASDEVRRAAQEQRTYWNKTSKETAETVTAVRSLVARTDANLNERLLPDTEEAVTRASTNFDLVATDLDGALGQLQVATSTLALQIGDPAISQTVQSLQESAGNTAQATRSLALAASVLDLLGALKIAGLGFRAVVRLNIVEDVVENFRQELVLGLRVVDYAPGVRRDGFVGQAGGPGDVPELIEGDKNAMDVALAPPGRQPRLVLYRPDGGD
jgi:hypothetical protein